MQIWMMNQYAVHPFLPGQTRHFEFAYELAARGHQVRLWSSSFLHDLGRFITSAEKHKILENLPPGVRLEWVWSYPYRSNDFRRVINMPCYAGLAFAKGLAKERPDVIVASSPHLLTGFAGWLASVAKRTVFILEVRDLWPETLEVMTKKDANSTIIKSIDKMAGFLYRKSAVIISLTEGIRDRLIKKGVPSEKVIFIPNGIHGEFFQVARACEQVRRELSFGDKFVCLYAGSHGPAKKLDTVVKAANILRHRKEILFVLVGDGAEKNKLIDLAQSLRLDNIRFLDPVPKTDIPDILNAADLFILSLQGNELFRGVRPNKLFEYMAIGKPVVCAIDGEARVIVEDNGAGIYAEPESPEAMARIVEYFYCHPELFPEIKKNAQRYIFEHCGREKLALELERVIITSVNKKIGSCRF